jgi:YHS domain-containing protein
MNKLLCTLFASVALLSFGACSTTSSTTTSKSAAMANTTCPVSNEALGKDACTTTYDGKTIGFCCKNCLTKFNGMSDTDKKAKVTAATPTK